jgi:hypothetical protein
MVKSGLACCVFTIVMLVTLIAQNRPNAEKTNPVILKYLGTAGWEITDGTKLSNLGLSLRRELIVLSQPLDAGLRSTLRLQVWTRQN